MDHYYGWSATIAASQKDGQLHMYTWIVKAGHILVIPLKLAQSSSPSSTCIVEIEQIPLPPLRDDVGEHHCWF